MSLLFIDSFDHEDGRSFQRKWTYDQEAGGTATLTYGRNGTGLQPGAVGCWVNLGVQNNFVVGFAYKTQAFANDIIAFRDITTEQCAITHVGDGRLVVICGSSTWGTSSWVMSPNTWYYFEVRVPAFGANERVVVNINAGAVIDDYGPTAVNSSGVANVVYLGGPGGGDKSFVDDFYALTSDGTGHVDFLGDVKVGVIRPNGDNTTMTDFGLSVGTSHFEVANDVQPDEDTTYSYGTTSDQFEVLEMEDISTTGTVYGAQGLLYQRKSAAGPRTTKPIIVPGVGTATGSTLIAGAAYFPSAEDYTYNRIVYETNPVTGSSWTPVEINNTLFGLRIWS